MCPLTGGLHLGLPSLHFLYPSAFHDRLLGGCESWSLGSTSRWDCTVLVFLCLISLSMCPQGSPVLLQMAECLSFSRLNNSTLCGRLCVHHLYKISHFSPSLLGGQSDCFSISACVTNATVNTGVQVSLRDSDFVTPG